MSLYKGNRRIKKPIVNGQPARMLLYQGRQIYPCRGVDPLDSLAYRFDDATDAKWFEVGFRSPEILTGNASAGWTDPRGYVRLELQSSADLQSWAMGQFVDCASTAIANADGTFDYWSRCMIPHHWEAVLVDLTATSDRAGKSITGISVMLAAVALSGFPYAMPSDAARLQTDLRAAGYTGATVTSTSAALTATARNHTVDGNKSLLVIQSGSTVTSVTSGGTSISLPSYPYTLPSARASLQADLRTAGLSGAVVMLHADSWEVTLPDRAASGADREFSLTIDPGDPFKVWDFYGTYQGENPAATVDGTSGNVRNPSGSPLLERSSQFARMRIKRGARALP